MLCKAPSRSGASCMKQYSERASQAATQQSAKSNASAADPFSRQGSALRIYSWNVNGIRAVVRKGELQKFMAKHKPDILALQETKAQQGQSEIDLKGYEEYWNSAHKAGYSGTA